MRAFAVATFATLLAASATAGPLGAREKSIDLAVTVSSAAFTTLAMNAAKTTDAINVWGLEYVTFTLVHTHDSATAVTVSCDTSSDTSTASVWAPIKVWTYTSTSTKESATKVWSTDTVASANWPVTVVTNAARWLRCTFTATAGAAADKLTVTAKGSVE